MMQGKYCIKNCPPLVERRKKIYIEWNCLRLDDEKEEV